MSDEEIGGIRMSKGTEFRVVLVTCGSRAEARKIATAVVGKRLAACVNILGGEVESTYWWEGKVETGRERLLILKTAKGKLKKLEEEVGRLHSYGVPEFLVVGVEGGGKKYLAWMGEVVGKE
jgi:periplasmic divalent cation tolerance protein